MTIERIVTGRLEENCYILKEEEQCLIIDPGAEADKIKKAIGTSKILGILLTHSHFDHIGALKEINRNKKYPIYKKSNVEEKEYQVGPFLFKVVSTPGHSSDSLSFYFKEANLLFTGDCLFKDTIGRCDLPTGNEKEMKESLKCLLQFPEETHFYPGHGEDSTLKIEKEENPYLKSLE